jgi:hypothetical protein
MDFQVIFVNYIRNTLVGCTYVNSFELIKLKGKLAFQENQVTLQGYCGGHPPQKMAPFFAKPFANILSTPQPKFWVNLHGTRAAKGRRSASRG